jgi:hypothetical protein
MEIEKRKNGKSWFKNNIMSNVVSSIMAVIAFTIFTSASGEWIIRAFGGATLKEFKKIRIFSPIDYFEEIKEGKYVRYADIGSHSSINWGKDEDFLLNMGLKPDREMFMRTIRVKYRSVLDINVSAGGTYDSTQSAKKFALVMTRIKINGIESAKDTEVFNGDAKFPVYSSASCSKLLEPGDYYMLVEGIFSGCVRNHDAWMQMKITRHQPVSYESLEKTRKQGYYPVSNGFVNADTPETNPKWYEKLILGKRKKTDRQECRQERAKFEARNPKSETNSNDRNPNDENRYLYGKQFEDSFLNFEHLNFDIVSDFDIRYSDLISPISGGIQDREKERRLNIEKNRRDIETTGVILPAGTCGWFSVQRGKNNTMGDQQIMLSTDKDGKAKEMESGSVLASITLAGEYFYWQTFDRPVEIQVGNQRVYIVVPEVSDTLKLSGVKMVKDSSITAPIASPMMVKDSSITRQKGDILYYEVYLSSSRLIATADEKGVSVVREVKKNASAVKKGTKTLYVVTVAHTTVGRIIEYCLCQLPKAA